MPGIVPTRRRIACGWGDWSLVAATLEALETAVAAFPEAGHFYLLSGDCLPIKPAGFVRARLEAAQTDWIECTDFLTGGWIRTGIREERLIYRHPFNERRQRRAFYAALGLQRALRLSRPLPEGLRVMIGSQWWCLRRETVMALRVLIAARPDLPRFFRRSWIPDETFFQTLVAHLVPRAQISGRPPTFLMFNDYGMPVTFHDDHRGLLLRQDAFFARKVSAHAARLRGELWSLWSGEGSEVAVSGDGPRQIDYLARRGREGTRYAPRIWDAGIGAGRRLLIVTCKKWAPARRLVDRLAQHAGVPALGHVFDDEAAPLPDLGGIERGMEKRSRHRRAVLRLIFDVLETDRLAICLDPSRIEVMRDFAADGCDTALLEMQCEISDDYLAAHAQRLGLAPMGCGGAEALEVAPLLPSLRQELAQEARQLRAAGLGRHEVLRQTDPAGEQAQALARALSIPLDVAARIVDTPDLFED
ncbi:DUF5928 domain-containing protein [Pseudoroseicyclus aestuarii]|uniref:Core-2/I-Branching enzyme n=1 Tax=Pseudoroseicyclus aestuarii TaxID=1795041 RepID=A0A318SU95_9RHOB|nr:DUF5928 domain-containing protein [Pseudoroseicyclus aestuarii]PYE83816.1 core-2/I-Branching enzyme [Pseudoroseicyclus aestuarii]